MSRLVGKAGPMKLGVTGLAAFETVQVHAAYHARYLRIEGRRAYEVGNGCETCTFWFTRLEVYAGADPDTGRERRVTSRGPSSPIQSGRLSMRSRRKSSELRQSPRQCAVARPPVCSVRDSVVSLRCPACLAGNARSTASITRDSMGKQEDHARDPEPRRLPPRDGLRSHPLINHPTGIDDPRLRPEDAIPCATTRQGWMVRAGLHGCAGIAPATKTARGGTGSPSGRTTSSSALERSTARRGCR